MPSPRKLLAAGALAAALTAGGAAGMILGAPVVSGAQESGSTTTAPDDGATTAPDDGATTAPDGADRPAPPEGERPEGCDDPGAGPAATGSGTATTEGTVATA